MAKIACPNKMKPQFLIYVAFAVVSYGCVATDAKAASCTSALAISIEFPKLFQKAETGHDKELGEIIGEISVTNNSQEILFLDDTAGDIGVAVDYKILLWSNGGFPVRMTHLAKRIYDIDNPLESDPPLNFENFGGSISPGQTISRRVNVALFYHIVRAGSYSVQLERKDDGECLATSNVAVFNVVK